MIDGDEQVVNTSDEANALAQTAGIDEGASGVRDEEVARGTAGRSQRSLERGLPRLLQNPARLPLRGADYGAPTGRFISVEICAGDSALL